jgi:hypothetical protein
MRRFDATSLEVRGHSEGPHPEVRASFDTPALLILRCERSEPRRMGAGLLRMMASLEGEDPLD